jgi:photosystem II stability/assembly factor-like uncharacterized protein
MSGMQDRFLKLAVAVVLIAGLVVAGVRLSGSDGRHSSTGAAYSKLGVPSTLFWQRFNSEEGDADSPLPAPVGSVTYEGNTDARFLRLARQAARLPELGHGWRNIGPYRGIKSIPGTGSAADGYGSVGGIGTAMAVDPHDKSGNTVYLGTIGGLYKTTNGGRTLRNVTEHKVPREAIGAVAIDPRHHNTVYIGTGVSIFTLSDDAVGTGVYVSHNGGKTWHRPVRNTHGYGVNAIAVNPKNGDVLVGTTYGLWRSTDHGGSFRRVHLPDHATHPLGNWLASIAINPHKPREVTVDVGFGFGRLKYGKVVLAPGNGLYRSENGGRTFTRMASNSQLHTFDSSNDPLGRASLAYSTAPGGQNVLWALVEDAGRAAGQHTVIDNPVLPVDLDGGTELNGLYRSGDDGKTWTLQANAKTLTAALGGTNSLIGYPLSFAEGVQASYNQWVLTDPVDPNRVYVGLEEAFTGEYHVPTKLNVPLTTTFTAIEKYANLCGFVTYPNRPPNTNGVPCPAAIPEYGGGTTHPDQHSAAIIPTPRGVRLYSGNDGGWWVQNAHTVTDLTGVAYQGYDNKSWTSLNRPATVLPWDVTRLQDGSYLLALQDNGVAHVLPNGKAYQVCGGDGLYVFPGANAHSYYCGIDGLQILGTSDDFKHTIEITPPDSVGATFASPWAVDPSDPNHLLAAAGTVQITTQGLQSVKPVAPGAPLVNSTWHTVFTPPKPPHGPWDSSAVFTHGKVDYVAMCSICRARLADGTVHNVHAVVSKIATNVKAHCKATVATKKCWHLAKSKGLPHEQIGGIAVDPKHHSTVYVGLRQMIIMGASNRASGAQKVMVSHNGGQTFQDLTGNLPLADVHRIVLRNGRLYVATDVGVFTAKAGSRHWSRFGTLLPEVTFKSMKLSNDGRYLVLGAYGRGGWVYDFGHKSRAY